MQILFGSLVGCCRGSFFATAEIVKPIKAEDDTRDVAYECT